jgi:hypothetical protein
MPSCSPGLGFFLFSPFCFAASTAFSCKNLIFLLKYSGPEISEFRMTVYYP